MYDEIAEIYEIWTESDPAAEPSRQFYLEQGSNTEGVVLEIGIGNGRISIELARRGTKVIGIDSSEAMISSCIARLNYMDENIGKNLQLVHANILEFHNCPKLEIVLLTLRTIGHFLTYEGRLKLFLKVETLLQPGGKFIFDHFVVQEGATKLRNGLVELIAHKATEKGNLSIWHSYKADFQKQIFYSVLTTELITQVDNVINRRVIPYELGWICESEVRSLAHNSGFIIESLFGGFDKTPFNEESREQVWVLRKPE